MVEQLSDYDPADALLSIEAVQAFLDDAKATGDQAYIAKAQVVADRARDCLERSAHGASRKEAPSF